VIHAPQTTGGAVREMPQLPVRLLLPFSLLVSDPFSPSPWSLVDSKSALSCLRVTGFGLLSGCFLPTTSTESGLHLVRSISWRVSVMTLLPALRLVTTRWHQLCIGDLTGIKTDMSLPTRFTLTLSLLQTISITMDLCGPKTVFTPTSMTLQMLFLMLISLKNPCGKEVVSVMNNSTPGETNPTLLLSTVSSSLS